MRYCVVGAGFSGAVIGRALAKRDAKFSWSTSARMWQAIVTRNATLKPGS